MGIVGVGFWKRRKGSVLNVSFFIPLISSLIWNLTCFDPCCVAPLTLLTISPLTLTFPFALTAYLFVAHTLAAPNLALGAAVIAGTVTALVGLFCVGLVKDTWVESLFLYFYVLIFLWLFLVFPLTFYSFFLPFPRGHISNDYLNFHRADTLYLCYCIDKEMGERRREEVFVTVRFLLYILWFPKAHFLY